MSEAEKQSSLTRAASMNRRGIKSNFISVSVAIFRKAFLWLAVTLLAIVQGAFSARAIIYTTPMIAQPESTAIFTWGDGTHELRETWSVNNPTSSGWVYGSSYGFNVDVYDAGHINLASVADASVFTYSTSYIHFTEGDTVFFRGVGGFYGAWYVADVYPSNNPFGVLPAAYLNGTAYFQSDGSGNFTSVPEPSNLLLLLAGLGLLTYTRRFTRAPPAQCE